MKNEALRMFLAISALILTAMLTSPTQESKTDAKKAPMATQQKPAPKKAGRKIASQDLKYLKFATNRFR